jgi:ankyrin repeat protein
VGRGANVEATDDEGKTCLDYANALGDDDRELMLNVLTGSYNNNIIREHLQSIKLKSFFTSV